MTPSSRRTRRAVVAIAVTGAIAVLTGCASTSTSGNAAPSSAQAAAATITTIDDVTLTVPSERPAVLFFFTVGCGECVTGGTALVQARAQAGQRADFLLVDLDPGEPRQAIDAFRQLTGDPALPVVTIGSLDLAQKWNVNRLSTAIVLDPSGTVTYRAVDPSAADLLAAIDKAAR